MLNLIVMLSLVSITSFTSYATNSDDTIVVGVSAHRCPMFYIDDDGTITGIGIDLTNEAAKEASLRVTYKDITEHDLKQALDNPEYDLVMPFGSAIKSEKGKDILVTDSMVDMPFTLLTLKTNNLTNTIVTNVTLVQR
ncbi:MAG: transporter substrate-binding domain-containing protein, partial [Butyrivibrio sp.]|nr:transporter substrate-binding domain-containing protein [Butyrivibrio sp.]